IPAWAHQNRQCGHVRLVKDPVASPPNALELEAQGKRGSSGNNSLMVYQVLDPAPYRGHRVRFGAKELTRGGAVNMTLFTPQKNANDFFTNLNSGSYVERSGVLDVPQNATFLSFALQIMGLSGAKAYVDDVFVTVEGAEPASRAGESPAPRAEASGNAEFRIDASKPGAAVNPLLFGMHIEWSDAGNGIVD